MHVSGAPSQSFDLPAGAQAVLWCIATRELKLARRGAKVLGGAFSGLWMAGRASAQAFHQRRPGRSGTQYFPDG